jgi:hypothetical protein
MGGVHCAAQSSTAPCRGHGGGGDGGGDEQKTELSRLLIVFTSLPAFACESLLARRCVHLRARRGLHLQARTHTRTPS